MKQTETLDADTIRRAIAIVLFVIWQAAASATDWPQYRGPTTDGISPDPILTNWPINGPAVLWRNSSISNGFSCLVVSQGRGFALKSMDDGSGNFFEYCVAVDAATGTNIWAALVDSAPWDPSANYNGGDGSAPYNTGDGPRATPSVKDGRVFVLSGLLHLVCMNVTNGAVIWNANLQAAYGGSIIQYESCESPCLDDDLIFVNLNSSTNNQNLAAFRTSDGSKAWSSRNENVTHSTPVVTTLLGVRQVIFATTTGLVSLNRTNGAFLWKYTYPFSTISVSMGAGPVVYSNMVYCTAAYGRGAAVARITLTNTSWTATQLYYKPSSTYGPAYASIWMTPVCYQGYIYTLCGENSTFLTTSLSCIELSTGNLQWSTNNFGMGGLIVVNSNLLVLTEKGDVVLAQCNPNAYTELARYRAFTFTGSLPGKCWNNPTYGDGRIYVHSTREAVALDVSVQPAPVIAVQPVSRAAVAGGSPSFSVVASNTPAIGYQWRFFATNVLAGRTNATLTLTNVQATNFGDYTVQVTNSGGAVTSSVAHLTHAVSPLISSNTINLHTLSLAFATEFGPAYFVEYKNILTNQVWTPLTNVPGTGLPITISDSGATNPTRFYRIRLQ